MTDPLPPLDVEQDDLHCPDCGKDWVWHGRDEKQRVCDECRFSHLEAE